MRTIEDSPVTSENDIDGLDMTLCVLSQPQTERELRVKACEIYTDQQEKTMRKFGKKIKMKGEQQTPMLHNMTKTEKWKEKKEKKEQPAKKQKTAEKEKKEEKEEK
ncbi:hypothetical protein LTR93_012007 [Exophiala xenobiotica]|nr:hypothetical protein LTR93_012007 [Exophiala xenobiotica]